MVIVTHGCDWGQSDQGHQQYYQIIYENALECFVLSLESGPSLLPAPVV